MNLLKLRGVFVVAFMVNFNTIKRIELFAIRLMYNLRIYWIHMIYVFQK